MLGRLARLALVAIFASAPACSAGMQEKPLSASERALRDGPASSNPDVVGRWLLAELISPGGTKDGAERARQRLAKVGGNGMYAALARALDTSAHGDLEAAGTAYVDALKHARGSGDPVAPLVAWYSINHLLTLDGAVPEVWRKAKPWATEAIESPGSLGWRARGELVDWWSRHAFEDAESDLLEKTSARYGCAKTMRIAGPFGRGAPADKWRTFPAEKPGPWPALWKPDPQRSTAPHVLKTERHGCAVRADEPVAPGVYYAETYLDVPATRDLVIAVQGAFSVMLDDHVLSTRDVRTWGVWPKFGVHVRLEPGRHRLLARVGDPETSIRLLRADGTPADVTVTTDATGSYAVARPQTVDDPNVIDRYLGGGKVIPPQDPLEAFLAAYLAAVEGQYDVASVLLEPLIADQEKATAVALASAASFAEKDPIFPDADARDLGRLLREKAVQKDERLYFPRLWLVVDRADKGMPEAAGEVRKMVDEFPAVPEIFRVLVSLYGRLGWKAERSRAALELVKRFPQDRGALETAIGVHEEAGRSKEADELAKRLKQLHPDSEIDLDRAILRRDYAAAVEELKRLGARRPDRKDIADRIAALSVRAGKANDPIVSLERALTKNPRDAGARLATADVLFARGDKSSLRSALASAIQAGGGTDELRGAIELVEGMTELEPYRIDGREVIKAYEKDPDALEGTAARVLDYSALWVHPDGSARMLEHEIVRVQSQEAIGKLAEQRVPPNALVLRMRVLKKDGRVLEPERVEGKPTITMPHLEVGDYIETENITSTQGDGEGGKRYMSPHWFFREADIAYWRSEFIVIAPRERPLVVETTGAVPAAVVTETGPLSVQRWRVDRSPAAPVEPTSAPIQEFLPSVRVGWGITLEGQLARMLDAATDDTPRDPRLLRIAQHIVGDVPAGDLQERARRLYRWVLANVEDGRESDGRRVVIGKSGSRAAAFLYLARCIGLPIEIAVVRDRLRPRDEGPLSAALSFSHLVLRLDRQAQCAKDAPPATCAPLWFTVGDRYAPFGFLPPELRAQPGVRLITGLPREMTSAGGAFDGIVYEATVELRTDGSAVLDLDQRFVGRLGSGIRSTVEQVPDEQLRSAVEGRLLARALPGARLLALEITDKDDLDKPLTLRMKVEVADFAKRRGDNLVIKPPLMMKIAGIAALETRQTPMLLPEATHTEVRLTVKLPPNAEVKSPMSPEEIRDGERLAKLNDQIQPGGLKLDRMLDIPAGRIQVEEYPAFRRFTQTVDEATSREILIQLH
jgi:cellulose synthase operon protein C